MQYKFRGLRADGKGWVYGDLRTQHNQYDALIGVWDRQVSDVDWIPVMPETVGMWTGAKDTKKIDIYEGDIVSGGNDYQIHVKEKKSTSTIIWAGHGFWVEDENFGWEGEGLWDWGSLTITGNIHQP